MKQAKRWQIRYFTYKHLPTMGDWGHSLGVIQTPLDLSVFVQVTLKAHQVCRIYGDLLELCWNLPKKEQTVAIHAFARKYGWEVEVHEPGAFGMVADFTQRRENQSEVQKDITDELPELGGELNERQAS